VELIALGGPVADVGGGWDWWGLLCIPVTFGVARRIVRLPLGVMTIVLSAAVGTILADVLRAKGVATAGTIAITLTVLGLLVRRSLSPQPPSV